MGAPAAELAVVIVSHNTKNFLMACVASVVLATMEKCTTVITQK
jgi:hypothetical protein